MRLFNIFLFYFSITFSQYQYPIKHFDSKDRLPHQSVNESCIDDQNNLWLATCNGLVKKFNTKFFYFYEEDGLASNHLNNVLFYNNKLWIGTKNKGLSVYVNNTFININKRNGLCSNSINTIIGYGNNIIVGTKDGISIIDTNTLSILSYNFKHETLSINDFFIFNNLLFCVSKESGIFNILIENKTISLNKFLDIKGITSSCVFNSQLYLAKPGILNIYDFNHNEGFNHKEAIKIPQVVITSFNIINSELYFSGSSKLNKIGGVFRLINNKFQKLNKLFNIDSYDINCITYDAILDNICLSTNDQGLYVVQRSTGILKKYLCNSAVLSCDKYKSEAIYITNYTLNYFKNNSRNILNRQSLIKNFLKFKQTNQSKVIDFWHVEFKDVKIHKNKIYLNTNVGLFKLDSDLNILDHLEVNSDSFFISSFDNLILHNKGNLIFYDQDLNMSSKYPLKNCKVVDYEEDKNYLYVLTNVKGLYRFSFDKLELKPVFSPIKDFRFKNIVLADTEVVISDISGDLYLLKEENTVLDNHLISRHKFRGNTISFLNYYKRYILIGTERGITFINLDTKNEIFVNMEQGAFPLYYCSKLLGSNLYVGTEGGVYKMDLEIILNRKSTVNNIFIDNIQLHTNEGFKNITLNESSKLAYNQNNISIAFRTNYHPFPRKLNYKYRISKNDSWNKIATNKIDLPFLPIGKHNLEVRVVDLSTGLSFTKDILKFEILPPFYKTIEFISFLIILFLLVVYLIYRYNLLKTQNIEKIKSDLEKRIESIKMEALLAQMNPHFVFNALNSIQKFIVDKNEDKATEFLTKFSQLIRVNLEHCNVSFVSLNSELEYLKNYIDIENERINNRVNVNLNVHKDVDIFLLQIPPMIIQPLIENVFVHAFPSRIKSPTLTINFFIENNEYLNCEIIDNGIGIKSLGVKKYTKSKGISLIKERLDLLNYNHENSLLINHTDKGTIVNLKLKLD